jgi:3-hydroxy-D-aspartate aldolase
MTRKEFLAASGAAVVGGTLHPSSIAAAAPAVPEFTPMPLATLPTPALVIDLPAFERNLLKMASHLSAKGVGLRPHAKTHKCAEIARRQLDAGAVGICCAKVSEAEALAAQGIGPILVTSPLATPDKVERLTALSKREPRTLVVVDSPHGAGLLSRAATGAGITIGVFIDLDVGTKRTGIACGEAAVAFARHVASLPGLKIHGVQAYAGHLMHVKGFEQRRQRSLNALALAAQTRQAIEAAGIPCPIFTGGGTGTFDIDVEVPGITDLQCGSYIFMDEQYAVIGGPDSERLTAFEPALFVWSTAISQPVPGSMTIDAGYKSLTNENVHPVPIDLVGVTYDWGGDEHGILEFEGESPLQLGEKTRIFIAHCDPTVNLFDAYHIVEGDQVTAQWSITARGCTQ